MLTVFLLTFEQSIPRKMRGRSWKISGTCAKVISTRQTVSSFGVPCIVADSSTILIDMTGTERIVTIRKSSVSAKTSSPLLESIQ